MRNVLLPAFESRGEPEDADDAHWPRRGHHGVRRGQEAADPADERIVAMVFFVREADNDQPHGSHPKEGYVVENEMRRSRHSGRGYQRIRSHLTPPV